MTVPFRVLAAAEGLLNTTKVNVKSAPYNATGDGVANDGQAFHDVGAFAVSNSPAAIIAPAGTYSLGNGATAADWARGASYKLIGAGIDVTTIRSTGSVAFGGKGLEFDNLHSARCLTARAGDAGVTLTDSSKTSLFVVGRYVTLSSTDLQGSGDPRNNQNFDRRKVVSAVSGRIEFDRPIDHDHLPTLPLYNDGSNYLTGGGMDQGGPATLYALHASYGNDVELRDLTLDQRENQTYIKARSVTLRRVKCVTDGGTHGITPTECDLFQKLDCDFTGVAVEEDKDIDALVYERTPFKRLDFASASINSLTSRDCTYSDGIIGTPKAATIRGGSIAEFRPGATGYGVSRSVDIGPSALGAATISSLIAGGVRATGANDGSDPGVNIVAAMSAGVITWPNSLGPCSIALVGANLYWVTAFVNAGGFRVTAVTQDGTNTYITTTWSGGFPTSNLIGGTKVYMHAHPCPVWKCDAGGCADIVDLSQSGAQNRPLYEYTKRVYAGASADVTGSRILLTTSIPVLAAAWGAVNFIKINVLTPYAGVGALSLKLAQFDSPGMTGIKADGSAYAIQATINAKIAGERTIAFGGNSGAQSGDTLPTLPEAVWLARGNQPILTSNVSAENAGPIISVEIDCNQGVS